MALLVGLDGTWLSVPYVDTEVHLQDGTVTEVHVGPHHTHDHVLVLRIGLQFGL